MLCHMPSKYASENDWCQSAVNSVPLSSQRVAWAPEAEHGKTSVLRSRKRRAARGNDSLAQDDGKREVEDGVVEEQWRKRRITMVEEELETRISGGPSSTRWILHVALTPCTPVAC